jgi:hypothetical protein
MFKIRRSLKSTEIKVMGDAKNKSNGLARSIQSKQREASSAVTSNGRFRDKQKH